MEARDPDSHRRGTVTGAFPWLLLTLALTLASALHAAPPGDQAQWAEGPVKHLMTASDHEQWRAVTSDEEAQEFIALFWARRDPTPGTPENELRVEFDRRVELADHFFTTKRTRGAMTDRGRALIVLGAPWQVGSRGPAAGAERSPTMASIDASGGIVPVAGPRGESAVLTWTYAYDKKLKFIPRKTVQILFVDDQGDGQYQFAKTRLSDPEALLLQAVESLIFAPDLTADPYAGPAVPERTYDPSLLSAPLQDAYEEFAAAGARARGPALLQWSQFVTPEGEIFVPIQIFFPGGRGARAGRHVTLFGLVEDEEGEIVRVVEEPVTLVASREDAYVDRSLTLAPGTYEATFGIADGEEVLSMLRTTLRVDELDPSASAISDMILSNNAYALREPQNITDPFAFGGFKVVPKADAQFSTRDDITFFFELRNPGLGKAGTPNVQAKIDITGTTADGKPVAMDFPLAGFPAVALPGVPGHFGLALTFPLQSFAPGRYDVRIQVIDTVLGRRYEAQKPFDVRG